MGIIELLRANDSGDPYRETFIGKLIVECNSGARQGTRIYLDAEGRYIGYVSVERRYWVFEDTPSDDDIESFCDTDEEFVAAMLKLGRAPRFST